MKDITKQCSQCNRVKSIDMFYKMKCGRVYNPCKPCKKKRKSDPTYKRNYYQKNKERKKEYRNKRRAIDNARRRERLINDPAYAMLQRCRGRIHKALKTNSKAASTKELTGLTVDELKVYVETQFADGMTWENRSEWHLDHRVPCKAFDFSDPEQQRVCFWYKNLHPMWAKDNMEKSNKYNEEEKQALISAYCNQ